MEMKKINWKGAFIIGGILATGSALIVYFYKQIKELKESCYTISGGVIHSLGLDNVKISLFFKIVNKSDITIKVEDMDFNIFVNKMFVSKITKKDITTIYSKSNEIIKLNFEFNPRELLRVGIQNIQPILTDKEKLGITVKGTFTVESGIVKLKNFAFEETFTLKEMLEPNPNEVKC